MELRINNLIFPAQRIFCIGRNYREHAAELNNELPKAPVVFMKPASCLVPEGLNIPYPRHGKDFQHEVEVVVAVGREGRPTDEDDALAYIEGLSLGLDLTCRDVQNTLKGKGLPWEKAKAFDYSAPLGSFTPFSECPPLEEISFSCSVNKKVRQQGTVDDMMFSIPRLLVELGNIWKLLPGDLLFTGTPSGVAPMVPGDTITVESEILGTFSWNIVEPE